MIIMCHSEGIARKISSLQKMRSFAAAQDDT